MKAIALALALATGAGSNKQQQFIPSTNQCANFSGTYVGKCEGESEHETLTITQEECSALNINDDYLQINRQTTESSSEKDSSEAMISSLIWAQDRQSIEFHVAGQILSHIDENLSAGIASYSGKGVLSKSTNGLNFEIKVNSYPSIRCNYLRK